MKANDVMVGDWVYCKAHKKNGRVYRIDQANGKGNGWIAVIDGDFHESRIEPILLTPKILENNCFTDYGESWFIPTQKNDVHIRIGFHRRDSEIDIYDEHHLSFRRSFEPNKLYVHNLQQALRICGIEKEIVL